ncbi:MAG: hypothetical protein EGS50_11895 [Alistipes senegalensis]|nr:hypothetical protein [Alistipes senegalensis]
MSESLDAPPGSRVRLRPFFFLRRAFQILRLGKNAGELAFSLGLFVFWLPPKILSLGKMQVNLLLPSLIRIFAVK